MCINAAINIFINPYIYIFVCVCVYYIYINEGKVDNDNDYALKNSSGDINKTLNH